MTTKTMWGRAMLLSALLAAPAGAFAAPTAAARPSPEARREGFEKHMRVMRVVGLAEALDLDEAGALKLDAAMRPFDERRRPLHEKMKEDGEILKRAADGDPAAAGQVDAALQRIFETRAQLEALNREMLETISKGMTPQQKAKLAVALAHLKGEMGRMGMMGKGMHGMHGMPGMHGGGEE